MSLLGVDVGTSSCKAVAFSNRGTVLASRSVSYARRGADEDNELDAEAFWESFVEVVRGVAKATRKDRINALAISAHGETIIPVDASGALCGPALLNRDHRSGSLIPEWEKRFGRGAIYSLTGLPVHAMYSLPKLHWLRETRPQVFARARKFATVADFLLLKMGLPHVVDYTLASRIMGFDIVGLKWSEQLLDFVGLSAHNFGEALPSGTLVGKLDVGHARALSLDGGVAVVLGGHDQPCGAFGAGGIAPGSAVDSAGSYECLTVISDTPKNTAASLCFSLNSYPHVVAGRYVTLGFFPSGLVIDWLLRTFFVREGASEAELRARCQDVEKQAQELGPDPTGICMTPHLIGSINPHWDIRASLSVTGIRAHHGKYHLYKALCEGIACELDVNLRALEEATGPISRLAIYGGGSRWDYGVQLRADVLGRRVERVRNREMVCRGAALLAGVGAGVYRNTEEAVAGTMQAADTFVPRPEATRRYAGQTRKHAALYEGLSNYRSLDDSDGATVPGARSETEATEKRR